MLQSRNQFSDPTLLSAAELQYPWSIPYNVQPRIQTDPKMNAAELQHPWFVSSNGCMVQSRVTSGPRPDLEMQIWGNDRSLIIDLQSDATDAGCISCNIR